MALTNINFVLNASNRSDARREITEKFLLEQPGTGTGSYCNSYEYEVEIHNNYKILLKRPARLNKGFDFQVNITCVNFLYTRQYKKSTCNYFYTYPKHQHIFDFLTQVKQNLKTNYTIIKNEIKNVYNFKQINNANISNFTFNDNNSISHPIIVLLLAIKWLFIEQDMNYWNYSGRKMLYDGLMKAGLV